MPKKEWELAIGQRGSGSSDPINDMIRRNMAEREKKKQDRDEEIEGLQHEAKVDELKGKGKETTPITIKPVELDVQSGEKAAQQRAESLEQRLTEEQKEHRETEKQLDQERINSLRTDFSRQLDDLKKLMESKGSTQSISEKLAEVKSTAGELGWGPQQQGGQQIPADIQIKLQEQDHRFKLEIENMKDDRDRRDKEWQLSLMKYGDEKEFKKQELQQGADANAERTQLMKGGLDTLGRIMGKAMVEPGSAPSSGIGSSSKAAKDYALEALEGEAGQFDCPGCGTGLYLAPDASRVQCASCGAMSNFTRIKKEAEAPPASKKGSKSEFTPAI